MSSETRHLSEPSDGTVALYGSLVGKLTACGGRTKDALVYSSAYLALIAAVQVAVAMFALSIATNLAPLVVGLVTFAVYAHDRIADADTDAVSNPRQAAFVRRHRNVLYVLASTAYGLAVAVSVLGGPVALGLTLLPGAFWILYASDWMPAVGAYCQRLKDVLVVNTTVVALAWAVTLTFLPLAFADAAFTPAAAVVFAYFFLGTFVNTEIPNVRDIAGDRAIGVATLPVVFGVSRTRRVLYGIDLLTAALVGYAALDGRLSLALAGALFVGLAYSLGVTALVGRARNYGRLTIAAECEYLLVALALVSVAVGF